MQSIISIVIFYYLDIRVCRLHNHHRSTYLIINGVISAAAMYALPKCFEKARHPGSKNKDRGRHPASRTSSRISLVSGGQH
jgi:hypothetical protein